MITKKEAAAMCRRIRSDLKGLELVKVRVSPCGVVSREGDIGCFCKEQWEETLPKASWEAVVLPSVNVLNGMPDHLKVSSMFPYWKALMIMQHGESAVDVIDSQAVEAFARVVLTLTDQEKGDAYKALKRAVRVVKECGGLRAFESLFGLNLKMPIGGVLN